MPKVQRVNIDYHFPERGYISTLVYGDIKNPQILALHGITHNSKFFDFFAKSMVVKGFCVIAPDLPGRGESSYFENEKNYNYKNYSNILKEVLPKLGVYNPIILGCSMGGLLSLIFLKDNYFEFSKLILNDIGYFIPSEIINKVGFYFKPLSYPLSYEKMRDKISKEFSQSNLSEIDLDYLFAIYTKQTTEGYIFNYDPKICSAFWRGDKQKKLPDMNYKDLWLAVNEIYNKPTFILRGAKSKFFPEEIFNEMISYPNVKSHILFDNIGHLPLLFNNDEVEKLAKIIKI
jgi:pimeloyl-ACP methyl ester carboxylesterase